MKVSVVITIKNEERSISGLLISLIKQTKKPDEIIIIDSQSEDKTIEIIRHFQKKDKRIKLLVKKCSRAEGRNVGVDIAKNSIIAMTDAGCLSKKEWLKRLVKPLENKDIEVVAGFYHMTSSNSMQKAMKVFLGVVPGDFDVRFLPSTRSIAFRKEVWERVGGFPENIEDTAEDTIFNYKLVSEGVKIARVKNAIVEWRMPETLSEFVNKLLNYAKGDARSKVWLFPGKGLTSHNIKAILIIIRYIIGLALLIFSFAFPTLLVLLLAILTVYILWSFSKVYSKTLDVKAGLWGIVLQITSDISVMVGFAIGVAKSIFSA